jgi:hypothetical protein
MSPSFPQTKERHHAFVGGGEDNILSGREEVRDVLTS